MKKTFKPTVLMLLIIALKLTVQAEPLKHFIP